MPEITKSFVTQDLHLAAYLLATGKAKLQSVVDGNSWKKTFELNPHPSDESISDFYSGAAQVSALRYSESLRSLKAAANARAH